MEELLLDMIFFFFFFFFAWFLFFMKFIHQAFEKFPQKAQLFVCCKYKQKYEKTYSVCKWSIRLIQGYKRSKTNEIDACML